jgi:hypothetical protein
MTDDEIPGGAEMRVCHRKNIEVADGDMEEQPLSEHLGIVSRNFSGAATAEMTTVTR